MQNTFFRIVAFAEGVSYLLLLFIAVPIKYFLYNDLFVKLLGMPHGVFFIIYIFYMEIIFNVEVNNGLENGFNCSCYAFCSRYFIMGRNYNGKGRRV